MKEECLRSTGETKKIKVKIKGAERMKILSRVYWFDLIWSDLIWRKQGK